MFFQVGIPDTSKYFNLEKNRENGETTREKETFDQSEGLILKSGFKLELSKFITLGLFQLGIQDFQNIRLGDGNIEKTGK